MSYLNKIGLNFDGIQITLNYFKWILIYGLELKTVHYEEDFKKLPILENNFKRHPKIHPAS